jgi:hypothetical protein
LESAIFEDAGRQVTLDDWTVASGQALSLCVRCHHQVGGHHADGCHHYDYAKHEACPCELPFSDVAFP